MYTLSPAGRIAPIDASALDNVLDQFLAEHTPTVSSNTAEWYKYRFAPFRQWWQTIAQADPILTEARLRLFAPWLEEEYRDHRDNQPQPATVRATIAKVRQFFRWCHQTGRLPVDISEWLPLPPAARHRRRFLTAEKCQALIDAVPGGSLRFRDWALISFLLATGARRFEAANALWSETVIDPETFRGHTHLRKTKRDANGRGVGRVVVFGPATGRALSQHRRFLEITGQEDNAGRIFGMSNTAIKMRFRKLADLAGFALGPHDLRRTFADHWWEHNADNQRAMILLKLQMGHVVERDITLNHYINLDNTPRLIEMLHASYTSPAEALQIKTFEP